MLGFSLGRKQAIGVVLLSLVGFCVPAPEPAAAAPRECRFESLEPEIPEYARAGGMIEIPVSDYSAGEDEFTGSVKVTPLGGESRTYPLELIDMRETPYGLDGRIVVPAPAGRNRATRVVLNWIEGTTLSSGVTFECSVVEARTIPIVPPGGKAGEPFTPRLEGRFRVNYRLVASGLPGVDRSERGVWRLRPLCRYFGCSTRLRSSLGLRDTFITALPTSHYDYSTTRYYTPGGTCWGTTRNRFTGELVRRWKIRRAFKETLEIKLWTTGETNAGRVVAFRGRSVLHVEPILSARRMGCSDKYVVKRIRGRLIRS